MPATKFKPGAVEFTKYARTHRSDGVSEYEIQVQGLDTLTEHFAAIAAVTEPLAHGIVEFYGQNIKENARRFVPIDTQATHDSIHTGKPHGDYVPDGGPIEDEPPYVLGGDAWAIDVGPTTYYARWVHNGTTSMIARPFMVNAIDIVENPFVASMIKLGQLADQFNTLGQASQHPPNQSLLGMVRGMLYSTAKAMGDVSAFAGRNVFGGWRSVLYGGARALGDVNAIMGQTVSARVTRRLSGRVTGRLIGVGSATLSHSATYSGFVGGSAGHRIYQRVAGRAMSGGVFSGGLGGGGGSQVGLTSMGRLP